MRINHRQVIGIGFILVSLGVILPLLMVMKIVESTFLLNFVSFIASLLGIFLGLMGAAQMAVESRRSRDKNDR
ncbi:MAG: hypothetical protein WCP19_01550 [Chloroflexota bacterium]